MSTTTYVLNNRMANGSRNPDAYYLLGEYLHAETQKNDGFFYAGHRKVTEATGIARSTHGDYMAFLEAEGYIEVTHVANRRFTKWVGDITKFRRDNAPLGFEINEGLYLRVGEYVYSEAQKAGGIFFLGISKRTPMVDGVTFENYLGRLNDQGFIRLRHIGNRRYVEWTGSIERFRSQAA